MSYNQSKPNLPYMTDKLVGLSGGSASDKTVDTAVKALKAYANGSKKTKPSKKMLAVLEKNGIITKTGGDCDCVTKKTGGKVSRIKKANKWADFSKDQISDAIALGAHGYEEYKRLTENPLQKIAIKAIESKMGGSAKRPPSAWIIFVKAYSKKHGITYGEALKKAGPEYRKMSGKGYTGVV